MPNSLKCKIKHLCHNGTLKESECERLLRALEREPCEDAVSREAVLRINELHHGQMPNHINHQIWEEVNELPPVTSKPTECEDAISREHLLSGIDELMQSPWFNNGKDFYDGTNTHYGYVERKEAVEIVRDLCVKTEPPVTPKQRTGKIIMGGYDCNHYICSECSNDFGWFSKPDYKYCPNCGAKMEGESE